MQALNHSMQARKLRQMAGIPYLELFHSLIYIEKPMHLLTIVALRLRSHSTSKFPPMRRRRESALFGVSLLLFTYALCVGLFSNRSFVFYSFLLHIIPVKNERPMRHVFCCLLWIMLVPGFAVSHCECGVSIHSFYFVFTTGL